MGRDTVTYIKIKPIFLWLWIGFIKQHPRDRSLWVKTVNVLQSKWKHSLKRWKFCKTLITKGMIIPISLFKTRTLPGLKFGEKFRAFHTGWLLIILQLHRLEPPDPISNTVKTTDSVQSTTGTYFLFFSACVNSLSSKTACTPKGTQFPLSRLPTGTTRARHLHCTPSGHTMF